MAEKTIQYLLKPNGEPRTLKCTLRTLTEIGRAIKHNPTVEHWIKPLTAADNADNFITQLCEIAVLMLKHEDPDLTADQILDIEADVVDQLLIDMVEVSSPRQGPPTTDLTTTSSPSSVTASG